MRSVLHALSFLLATSVALGAGCTPLEPEKIQAELQVRGRDDRGLPVSDIRIELAGTELGATNQSGDLVAQIRAVEGQRYGFRAECPSDYGEIQAPSTVVFRQRQSRTGATSMETIARVTCPRRTRVGALLVNAAAKEDLPILVDGVVRGQTGPGGFAHLRLVEAPGASLLVSLDTSNQPHLRPIDPQMQLRMGETDTLFVFAPTLTEEAPKPRKRRKRKRRAPEPSLPKRPIRVD